MDNNPIQDKRTSWGFSYKVKTKPKENQEPKPPKPSLTESTNILDQIKTGIDTQLRLSEGNGQLTEPKNGAETNFRQFDSFFERHMGDRKIAPVEEPIIIEKQESKPKPVIVVEDATEAKTSRKSEMFIEEAIPVIVQAKEPETIKDRLLKQFETKDAKRCVEDLKTLHSDVFKLPVYKILIDNEEMKNFQKSKKSRIHVFQKLINFLRRDERINLKGQDFYPYDCFCVPFEYVDQFIKETMAEMSKVIEPETKTIITRENIKNTMAKERNEVLKHMLANFESIIADLEDIEKNKGADWEGLKHKLVQDFDRVQKHSKHLTYQKDIGENLNRRNYAFVEKNLESFSSCLRILEDNYNELDNIIGKVEGLEKMNLAQKNMLFDQLYEPFSDVYEASSLGVCKELLGLD